MILKISQIYSKDKNLRPSGGILELENGSKYIFSNNFICKFEEGDVAFEHFKLLYNIDMDNIWIDDLGTITLTDGKDYKALGAIYRRYEFRSDREIDINTFVKLKDNRLYFCLNINPILIHNNIDYYNIKIKGDKDTLYIGKLPVRDSIDTVLFKEANEEIKESNMAKVKSLSEPLYVINLELDKLDNDTVKDLVFALYLKNDIQGGLNVVYSTKCKNSLKGMTKCLQHTKHINIYDTYSKIAQALLETV